LWGRRRVAGHVRVDRLRIPRHVRLVSPRNLEDETRVRRAPQRSSHSPLLATLLRGSLPPLRGKDRKGGVHETSHYLPPFLTFTSKGGRTHKQARSDDPTVPCPFPAKPRCGGAQLCATFGPLEEHKALIPLALILLSCLGVFDDQPISAAYRSETEHFNAERLPLAVALFLALIGLSGGLEFALFPARVPTFARLDLPESLG